MKFTKIPEDTFKQIQLNAGVLCETFDPKTGEVTGLVGATTGGVSFATNPSYTDFGEDIDNCPKQTKELKKLDSMTPNMSGNFVTATAASIASVAGAADVDPDDPTHIIPRVDILDKDFKDLWWVGDYSDENSEENGGFIAIHMMNVLNTDGFQITSTDKGKGQFAFNYAAHFSIKNQTKVPFELYVKAGGEDSTSSEPPEEAEDENEY